MPRYEVKITTYTTMEAENEKLAIAGAMEALEDVSFEGVECADFCAWGHDDPECIEVAVEPGDEPDDAQAALDAAADAQTAFWEAMRRLENVVGFDVDQDQELAGMTVDDLPKDGDEDDEDEEGEEDA